MSRGRKPKPCPVSYDELRAAYAEDSRMTTLVAKYGAGRASVVSWLKAAGIQIERKPMRPRGAPLPFGRLVKRSSDGKRVTCTLYNIWHSMRLRCLTKGYRDYKYYGGRGVTICPEWNDYAVFRAWAVSHGFRKGLTLDRKLNDVGYTPDNCAWATMQEQCVNKCSVIMVEFRGERGPLWRFAERLGMDKKTVRSRVRMQGWSAERALTTPIESRRYGRTLWTETTTNVICGDGSAST